MRRNIPGSTQESLEMQGLSLRRLVGRNQSLSGLTNSEAIAVSEYVVTRRLRRDLRDDDIENSWMRPVELARDEAFVGRRGAGGLLKRRRSDSEMWRTWAPFRVGLPPLCLSPI